MIVWDAGPFRLIEGDDGDEPEPLGEQLKEGKVEVWLEGRKIRGGYVLVHAEVGGDEDNWLLIKKDDDAADARRKPTKTEPESVVSGRTLDEVAREEEDSDGDE